MKNDTVLSTKEIIQDLLKKTHQNIEYFLSLIDVQEFCNLVDYLFEGKGTIFFTGVGKSGAIAKKIAMTMSSCGMRSLYLSPVNATHGDLGVVTKGDVVLLFSKSGESDELLQLCPALRNKGAELIAIVSNKDCRLTKASNRAFFLPVLRELCPFDLAPTTSTVIQLIFGDILAISLMNKKEYTLSEFITNHPAGRIGKRLTLRVQDLMYQGDLLPICKPNEKIMDVLVELSKKKCGCILICENENFLGIFTDGDLRRALQSNGIKILEMPIKEFMTKQPRVISSYELAFEAMKQMEQNQKAAITVMPVVDDGQLVGLIRLHDIIQSGI